MAPKVKDIKTHNNLLLIRYMKELGRDLWYKAKIEESDQLIWKAISRKTRLKLIFIQPQWIDLRDQYVRERRDELENSSGQQTEFLKKYSEPMNFLENDAESWLKCLSGQNSSEVVIEKDEVEIKKDEVEIEKDDLLEDVDVIIVGEGETEVIQISDDEQISSETKETETKGMIKSGSKRPASQCDDTIFFKTIETKLLKMDFIKKEQAKKEILKILQ